MQGLLDVFIGYLRAERGAAAKTVDAYAADITRWLTSLEKAGYTDIDQISRGA